MSTTEAAKELGLSRRRVTEFVRDGALEAQLLSGNRWVIDERSLAQFKIRDRRPGRPWDSGVAWDIVEALSDSGHLLSARSALRLRVTDSVTLAAQVKRLITIEKYDARKLDALDKNLFLTGDSAVSVIDPSIHGGIDVVHAYSGVDNVARHFNAIPYSQGNLAVYSWRDGKQRVFGATPWALIAIDATRSGDARVRHAGYECIEKGRKSWLEKNTN